MLKSFTSKYLILLLTLFTIGAYFYLKPKEDKGKLTLALTMISQHPSLMQAKIGALAGLHEAGFSEENLRIIEDNASGSIASAAMIARKFQILKPAAIISISTPSSQNLLKAIRGTGTPLIFASVTDPVAAGLMSSWEEVQENITGVVDFPDIPRQWRTISQLLPSLQKIGVLYNPGEANSISVIESFKKQAPAGVEVVELALTNSNDMQQIIMQAQGKIEAIYMPSDNVVFSALPKLVQITRKLKIPTFSGDADSVSHGVLAAVGYSQYAVGYEAGLLAAKALKGRRNMPVVTPPASKLYFNETTAKIIGLELPMQLRKHGEFYE